MANKKIPFIFLLCLSLLPLSAQENSQNLRDYVDKNSDKFFFFHTQTIGQWKEMNIQYAQPSTTENTSAVYTLFANKEYAFAQLIVIEGKSIIYYDSDGDGLLNMSSDFLYVPWWVVWKTSSAKSDGKDVLSVMDILFDSLNGTSEPFETIATQNASARITRDENSVAGRDRDLFYLLFLYMTLKDDLPKESLNHILILEKFLIQRAGQSHPLCDFYLAQTALDMGDAALAIKRLDNVLSKHPAFVPALILRCLVEPDQTAKKNKADNLLKKHTSHWMVVDYYQKLQKAAQ